MKAEKYEFHVSSDSFLGYSVANDNIQMDPLKVSAVASWLIPGSCKQLQHFLGFTNIYQRFIRNWTDHKNLEYKTAKRRNSCQACWSLFFTWFNFVLFYCPGSSNIKPNALSRQFLPSQLLPIPHRPWSRICLEFVTSLPPSYGNVVILTMVDRFSKIAHFIPLIKLPAVKETAQLVLEQVFHLHGLLMDVVSNQGPQVSSVFW